MKKVIRTSTIPLSLDILLKGQLRFLNQYYEIIAVSGEGQHLRNVEQREGVHVFPVAMQRNVSPVRDLVSLWMLYRFFRREKPDFVHSITPKAGLLSMAAAFFAGVPLRLHTFTGLIFPYREGISKKVLILTDSLLCFFATHIYPEGIGVRNDLINYKITHKNLKVIANGNINGIDPDYFNPSLFTHDQRLLLREKSGIGAGDFVFVFVGRITGDKGITELVKAFLQFAAETGRVKLLLVGPQEPDLDPLPDEIIREIISNKNIISTGFQDDVRPWLAVADVMVFPSYREGFPNVVMQAGAMGLPCIVTNINGSNEIIINGENGIIIPLKDTQATYSAMKRIADDTELFSKLRQNSRQMIISRYDQQMVWKEILAEYKRIELHV